MDSSGNRITFDSATWYKLQQHLDIIESYFCFGNSPLYLQTIELGKYALVFTTAHRNKAMLLRGGKKYNHKDNKDIQEGEVEAKKKKVYAPEIDLQKSSFEGLKNVIVCVDERFKRIKRLLKNVEACKDISIKTILNYLVAKIINTPNEEIIRQIIKFKFTYFMLARLNLFFLYVLE